jgi:YD repeat-containing protein
LAFLKDRAGNQIAIDFDHLDRPYRVITGQAQLGLKYDERGHIVTISHHGLDGERLGTLAQYTYDEHGDLVTATDRYGNTRQYKY